MSVRKITLTPDHVQSLREEAQAAGDQDMVTICDLAMIDDTIRDGTLSGRFAWIGIMGEAGRLGLGSPISIRDAALDRIAEMLNECSCSLGRQCDFRHKH